MAGELAMVERETEKSTMADWQWRWRAQYSRYFPYPSSFLSSIDNNHLPLSLSSLDRKNYKPTWLSTAEPSTVVLHLSDHRPELSVITVSVRDTLLEEHYVSKLHFAWPWVSCLSGFPARGSLVVIASYIDSTSEKQKFALQFLTPSDLESFTTSLEDVLSNRLPKEPTVDVTPVSSQSEFIPTSPYRPDTTRMMSPVHASSEPKNFLSENQQESQFQTQDRVAEYENNDVAFPPRFTSLVSSCSAEQKQSGLALTMVPEFQEPDMKAAIERYMQDASFLDMVSKVNEVITELGGDYAI